MATYELRIGFGDVLTSWTDLAFNVGTLPSAISAGSFALIASKTLSEPGLFAPHMGAVYMPSQDGVWFFGNETHSSEAAYNNSAYHLDLADGKVYRDYTADAFPGDYRIDANGICWANTAKTRPWGQHAFRQMGAVSSTEFVLAYPTPSHANLFFGSPPTYTPTYEGGFTIATYKDALWYYNVATATWRVDSASAASANTAGIMGTGYGIVYSPTRGTLMGTPGDAWRELNITTFARESSSATVSGGSFNACAIELDDGNVLVGVGGDTANTNVFSIVDPDAPGSFTNVAKPGSLSAYSFQNTGWVKTGTGKIVGFVKDTTNNQLRAVIWDPADSSWTDTGHTLSVGSDGVTTSAYWLCVAYASAYNVVILASNAGGQRRVWGYKPSSGV